VTSTRCVTNTKFVWCEVEHTRLQQKEVESANRTLETAIPAYSVGNPNLWGNYLQQAVFSMNASRQATTGYSPFYLVTDQHAAIPLAVVGQPLKPGITLSAEDVVAAALPERVADLNNTNQAVVQNVGAAQERQAKSHAKRVRGNDDGDPAF
jgi:hypothetical protein